MYDDLTIREILIAILGSGGIIGGLFVAFNFIAGRFDKYRERKKMNISEAAEIRRVELQVKAQSDNDLVTNLWKLVEAGRKEIEELERAERLARPTVVRVYRIIREMRAELDKLHIMVLGEQETAIFAKRWNNIKKLADQLEAIIAGDDVVHHHTSQDPNITES